MTLHLGRALCLAALVLAPSVWAETIATHTKSIYLVRHAEKIISDSHIHDPQLTECGHARAQSLAHFFKKVPLNAIYSTNYLRTLHTAEPVANVHNLKIQEYNPRQLEQFAQSLLQQSDDLILVVGHSNTTATLAGLLSAQPVSALTEADYDRLYQVVLNAGNAQVNVFHQTFKCSDQQK